MLSPRRRRSPPDPAPSPLVERAVETAAPQWYDAAMNARTQITMDPALQRRAQEKAAELGISFAEYVRRLLAQDLGPEERPEPKADISVIFDLGASEEPTDIARDKDKMVGQAVWEEYLRDIGRAPRHSGRAGKGRR